jgi:glutaredoxin
MCGAEETCKANGFTVIIFSKTYCPYSRKAKSILLNKYDISPAPYVVELDEHELGPGLQDQLSKTTSRRTVPNILVNGVSIGGGDDIEELHTSGKLIQRIESLTGKRVQIKAVES